MNRRVLDKLIASIGVVVSVVLLAASAGLVYTYSFVHSQVHDQLAAEKITFPAADSESIAELPDKDRAAVMKYAGQQLLDGAQAKVFADHYIAAHLKNIGGGKTYSELSAASLADPSDAKLAGQVQTVFRGETLRGLLLNAYAFDTMAMVARAAAFVSFIGGVILFGFSAVGYVHANRINGTKKHPAKKRR